MTSHHDEPDTSRTGHRTVGSGTEQTGAGHGGTGEGNTERAEEVWTFVGRREFEGKRYYAWQDAGGAERYFAKVSAVTVGGRYTVTVTRGGDGVAVYGNPLYTGELVDERFRREMEALDLAALAAVAAATRDRSDSRRKALDEAIQPLADIAATLRFGHDQNAFLAYVIRRITRPW